MRPLHVFLCHSSGDKPTIRDLYKRLRGEGFEPRLDEENLLAGQDWQREIQKAVRDSYVVIVCLSRTSINKAGYVQKEIKYALDAADEQPEGTIFIIPLKLEECEIPERLQRWQWVEVFPERGYKRLIDALHARASTPPITITPREPKAEPAKTQGEEAVNKPSLDPPKPLLPLKPPLPFWKIAGLIIVSGTVALGFLLTPSPCSPPPAGIIGWWDGDSVVGTTARDIKGTHNGQLRGGVKMATGFVGGAFEFDGITGQVEVPDAVALSPKNGLTLEAWVYRLRERFAPRIVGKQVDDDPFHSPYVLGLSGLIGGASEIYFGLFDGYHGQVFTSEGEPIPIKTWSHVAATWDGEVMRSYLGGQEQHQRAFDKPYYRTTEPLRIGKGSGDTYGFRGLIDELTLYNRALGAVELAEIVEAGAKGKCKP